MSKNKSMIILDAKKLTETEKHIVFPIRVKRETAARLDVLAAEANVSRSKLISNILNATLNRVVIGNKD